MNPKTLASSPAKFVQGFLKWFWRQSIAGMVITTGAIVIAGNYLLAELGVAGGSRSQMTTTAGWVLLMIAVFACFSRALFGNPRRRR